MLLRVCVCVYVRERKGGSDRQQRPGLPFTMCSY